MFLIIFNFNIPIFRSGVVQVVFISECYLVKLAAIKCFFNVMFSFSEKKKTNWLWHKYCKIKLHSGAILHGASNEPEAYLEPSQTSTREHARL